MLKRNDKTNLNTITMVWQTDYLPCSLSIPRKWFIADRILLYITTRNIIDVTFLWTISWAVIVSNVCQLVLVTLCSCMYSGIVVFDFETYTCKRDFMNELYRTLLFNYLLFCLSKNKDWITSIYGCSQRSCTTYFKKCNARVIYIQSIRVVT